MYTVVFGTEISHTQFFTLNDWGDSINKTKHWTSFLNISLKTKTSSRIEDDVRIPLWASDHSSPNYWPWVSSDVFCNNYRKVKVYHTRLYLAHRKLNMLLIHIEISWNTTKQPIFGLYYVFAYICLTCPDGGWRLAWAVCHGSSCALLIDLLIKGGPDQSDLTWSKLQYNHSNQINADTVNTSQIDTHKADER